MFCLCARARHGGTPTGASAAFVDDPVVRDRENPAAQGGVVAAKLIEAAQDVNHDVAEHVLAVGGTRAAEIGVHGSGEAAEHHFHRARLVTHQST
jgi:hypothetical protein